MSKDFIPLTLDELPGMLSYLPNDDRDLWVQIGMAVKAGFGSDGFTAWDTWSSTCSDYNAQHAKAVWKSIKSGSTKLATAITLAKQAGWTRKKLTMSREDRQRLLDEQEQRRKAHQLAVEADERKKAVMNQAVSTACQRMLEKHCQPAGETEYLARKKVGAYGVFEVRCSVLLAIDDQREAVDLFVGSQVKEFFNALPKPRPDHLSFMTLRPGTLIVPLRDQAGQVWSIQSITPDGKKMFPRYSRKSGCFHVLGNPWKIPSPIAIAEGYSTAATVHMATGWQVAMAVDSGNMLAVARAIRALYPDAQLVIAGDDDRHHPKNPGRAAATEAAAVIDARIAFPVFPALEGEAA